VVSGALFSRWFTDRSINLLISSAKLLLHHSSRHTPPLVFPSILNSLFLARLAAAARATELQVALPLQTALSKASAAAFGTRS
jgi:hypothetical protein